MPLIDDKISLSKYSKFKLVDFFVVAGLHEPFEVDETANTSVTSDAKTSPCFKGAVTLQYPENDEDRVLPDHLAMFAFPDGLSLQAERRPAAEKFSFALTDLEGQRMFGSTLIYWSPLSDGDAKRVRALWPSIRDKDALIYAPTCLCIVSQYPMIACHHAMLERCHSLLQASSSVPLERLVANFVYDIPLPPLGTTRIKLYLNDSESLYCERPSAQQLPLLDVHARFIFDAIGIADTIRVWNALLLSHKVVLVSKYRSLLFSAVETLCSLLYPFKWPYVVIPVLPVSLIDFLEAPTPFLMGLTRVGYELARDSLSDDVILVDLDVGVVDVSDSLVLEPIPSSLLHPLVTSVRAFLHPHLVDCDAVDSANTGGAPPSRRRTLTELLTTQRDADPQTALRMCFVAFFASILVDYEHFVHYLRRFPTPVVVFDKPRFLRTLNTDIVAYASYIVESQAFVSFIEKRHRAIYSPFDATVEFFHNAYARDRAELVEDLCSMEVMNSTIKETYVARRPDTRGLEAHERFSYTNGVIHNWDQSLFPLPPPRHGLASCFPLRSALYVRDANSLGVPLASPTIAHVRKIELLPLASAVPLGASHGGDDLLELFNACLKESKPMKHAKLELLFQYVESEAGMIQFLSHLKQWTSGDRPLELSSSSFDLLSETLCKLLAASERQADIVGPLIVMRLSARVRRKDSSDSAHVLRRALSAETIWMNSSYWVHALYLSIAEARATLPQQYQGDVQFESLDVNARQELVLAECELVFNSMKEVLHAMVELGVPEDDVQTFMSHHANECMLGDDDREALSNLIARWSGELGAVDTALSPKRKLVQQHPRRLSMKFDYAASSQARRSAGDRSSQLWSTMLSAKGSVSRTSQEEKRDRDDSLRRAGKLGKAAAIIPSTKRAVQKQKRSTNASVAAAGGTADDMTAVPLGWSDEESDGGDDGAQNAEKRSAADAAAAAAAPVGGGTSAGGGTTASGVTSGLYGPVAPAERELWRVRCLVGHKVSVEVVVVGKDVVVSGDSSGTLIVWDAKNGAQRSVQKTHTDRVTTISLDNLHGFVSGSDDSTCAVCDLHGTERLRLRGHQGAVTHVDVHWERSLIATVSFDKTARLWNARSGDCVSVLKGHESSITCCQFDAKGGRLVTASRELCVWDTKRAKQVHTLHVHDDWVSVVQVDGKRILSGGFDGRLCVWSLKNATKLWEASVGTDVKVHAAVMDADGVSIIAACSDGLVRWYDTKSGTECVREYRHEQGAVTCLKVQQMLAIGGGSAAACWSLEANDDRSTPLVEFIDERIQIQCLDFSGTKLVSGGNDANVRIYDIKSTKLQAVRVESSKGTEGMVAESKSFTAKKLAVSKRWAVRLGAAKAQS